MLSKLARILFLSCVFSLFFFAASIAEAQSALTGISQEISVRYETATDITLTATGGTPPYSFTVLDAPYAG